VEGAPQSTQRGAGLRAALLSPPLATALVALLTLTQAHRALDFSKPALLAGALAHGVAVCVEAVFASLIQGFVWLELWRRTLPDRRGLWLVGNLVLGVGLAWWLCRGFGPFEQRTLVASLGLGVAWAALGAATGVPFRHVWLRFGTGIVTLGLTLAACAVAVSQYGLRYRSVGVSSLGFAYGFGLLLFAQLPLPQRARLRASTVSTLLLIGLGLASLFGPQSAGRAAAVVLTTAGRSLKLQGYSPAIERASSTSLPAIAEPERAFETQLGLPELPATLAGYSVLLITSEATRFDQTSLADAKLATTPQLARLAEKATYDFRRAYSPGHGSLATAASLMTLTHATAAELTTWRASWYGELRPEAVTLAELFRQAGFRTFRVTHNFHDVLRTHMLGLEQGFDFNRLELEKTGTEAKTLDARITQGALDQLQQLSAAGAPFFGWVFYGSPHAPYVTHFPEKPHKTRLERYRQELMVMDRELGRLLDGIDRLGLASKTVVVFTGDHGEEIYDHGGEGHYTLHEECIRVPLLVRIPQVSGGPIERPISSLQVLQWLMLRHAPPLAEAARRRLERETLPLLRATGGAVISESVGHDDTTVMLLRYPHKLICYMSPDWCDVYDLRADPGERQPSLLDAERSELWSAWRNYRQVRAKVGRFRTEPARE
jgi:arylsulfatase A-like enzyme